MKILFIGGNGNISWYCTQMAIERGHEVWQINREETVLTRRTVQPEVHKLKGDMRDVPAVKKLLASDQFDAVCDFICYNRKHAESDLEIFNGRTEHFLFISSDSVYRRDVTSGAVSYTENSEKYDVSANGCDYITGKLEAENVFLSAYQDNGFPVTVIRPSYTYDTIFPVSIGHNCFSAAKLILDGYPLLIAGDGNNLWPFTHSSDFARAFIRLAENPDTIGECINICTDELLTWNRQSELVLEALRARDRGVFHVPYQDALELNDIQPREMMVQRMQNTIVCLDKLKKYVPDWSAQVPFKEGIQQTVDWLDSGRFHKRYVARVTDALTAVYQRYGITPLQYK